MKAKKHNKKLSLNKTTITALDNDNQRVVKGGYFETVMYQTCYSWHPVCATKPYFECPADLSIRICPID